MSTMAADDHDPASDTAVSMEPLMHKNRLQEHAQRSSMALPVYQNVNEGVPHCPKFRSTVVVDGVTYTSQNTFLNRKAAEQDVSKYAMDCILNKIQEEKCSLLYEDVTLCKSILHEFSVKNNLGIPAYTTSSPTGKRKYYLASMALNGITYNGEICQSKKMAEQLAARAAINTLLGKLESGKPLYEIIKSKAVKFPEIWRAQQGSSSSSGVVISEAVVDGDTTGAPEEPEPQPSLITLPQVNHEFKKPKIETRAAAEAESSLPIIFVPQQQQNLPVPPSFENPVTTDRRQKNKKTKMRMKMKKRRAMELSGGDGGGAGGGGGLPYQPVEQNA